MKTFICLVLAVVAAKAGVINSPESVEDVSINPTESRAVARNFVVGTTAGYRELWRGFISRPASADRIQVQDVTYTTNNPNIRIWGARALYLTNQGATVRVIAGGIGQNTMTLRIQSARGRGFWYDVSFWGI